MIKSLSKKLNSSSGVTILYALLFLAVASMTSALVLSAANSASKQVYEEINQKQEYLAVQSASDVIVDEICKNKFELKQVSTKTSSGTNTSKSVETTSSGSMNALLKEALTDYYKKGLTAEKKYSFIVSSTDVGNTNVVMTIDSEYNIRLELTVPNQDVYYMTVILNYNTQQPVTTKSGETTTTVQPILWNVSSAEYYRGKV